jgi:hypothetical protein
MLLDAVEQGGIGVAYGRDQMSLKNLMTETGLSRRAVIDAKAWLCRRGLVIRDSTESLPSFPDSLALNSDFGVHPVCLTNAHIASANVAQSGVQ